MLPVPGARIELCSNSLHNMCFTTWTMYTFCRRAEQVASSALTEFPLAYHIEELSEELDNVEELILEALDLE